MKQKNAAGQFIVNSVQKLTYIFDDFKNASPHIVMYFSNSTFKDIKHDLVLITIVKLNNLKRLQEHMSCVTTYAFNRSTSLPVNFVYNFFMIQPLRWIAAFPRKIAFMTLLAVRQLKSKTGPHKLGSPSDFLEIT